MRNTAEKNFEEIIKYEYYSDCLDMMRQLHWNIYQILNYYYDKNASTPDASSIVQAIWE